MLCESYTNLPASLFDMVSSETIAYEVIFIAHQFVAIKLFAKYRNIFEKVCKSLFHNNQHVLVKMAAFQVALGAVH